jgi:DNA-binding NtrC family response regulator
LDRAILEQKSGDARLRILCVYPSLDVCTFLREILCTAGFNALTTTAVEDAPILLKATKARVVIVSARVQMLRGKSIRAALQEIVPDVKLLLLHENFALQDPADAAEGLLKDVSAIASQVVSPA